MGAGFYTSSGASTVVEFYTYFDASTPFESHTSFDASTVGEGAMGEAAALCEGAGWHGAFREAVLKLSAASTSVGG